MTTPAPPTTSGTHEDTSIVCDGLVKIYKVSGTRGGGEGADLEVVALQGLDLVVESGELVAIVGASGSGKSTLLNILGGLDTPSAGQARVGSFDLLSMSTEDRTAFRRSMIGFVWQQTAKNLLPYLSARRNVELPLALAGVGRRERRERAAELLDLVGLTDRADNDPGALSGGEQQRVAIATALANEPRVLLADEPTGELDTDTSTEVFEVIRDVNRRLGVTCLVLTHDPLVSERVDRTVQIRDGRTSTETLRRESVDHVGATTTVADTYAVLDRVGRLQLPEDHVAALGLGRRVRLELVDDHIEVWPVEGDRPIRPVEQDRPIRPVEQDRPIRPVEGER